MTEYSHPIFPPLFGNSLASDEAVAAEVQSRVGFVLPEECVEGVAMNARLLQRHYESLVAVEHD
jgi:hypothetical protein